MSYGQGQRQSAFATNDSAGFGQGFSRNAGEEEDLAVYNWGDSGNLLDGDDDALNDETFGGDVGEIASDFQWAAPAPVAPQHQGHNKPRGPIASTQSRYKPKVAYDPFAASEDDFYAPRPSKAKATPATSKPVAPAVPVQSRPPVPAATRGPPPQGQESWNKPTMSQPMWGAAPSSSVRPPPGPAQHRGGPPPAGQIKTLEEIEAEMTQMDLSSGRASAPGPPLPSQPQVRSLEEIEREMLGDIAPPPQASAPQSQPAREDTPVQPGLAGSGYAKQQALLDSMFPQLGQAPVAGQQPISFPDAPPAGQPMNTDQLARAQALHDRITTKIKAMSQYNNCMGSSDKDFITRIQLSQLATADPYTSDFYAQVYTAIHKSRPQGPEEQDGPAVVKVGQVGFGVGGASGNRFGQMGNKTMQKLSSQVKKLVEQRNNRQMTNDALQGALGRVSRASTAAPRPVLAVPTAKGSDRRVPQLNQDAGIRRQALTRKQVLVAIEELYDQMLELEQMRRDIPPPNAVEQLEGWNAACQAKSEEVWRRLMVMEPLDISDPHPFISLMNPLKGQKMFPRLIRHLNQQQALTLLTLLIATYPQLDVVARAPPPPVADSSLLTKADRKDRARREAETDQFLQYVVPGLDMIINRCNLGLVAGLLTICAQRMDLPRVASTRPGVALFTALLSRGQSLIRVPVADPANSQAQPTPDPSEVEQWNKTFAYFLSVLLPRLPELFPSSMAQRTAFGPGAYLLSNDPGKVNHEMERREAEVWGLAAALAVNAPEEEQTNLVAALRDTILHTVQSARNPSTPAEQAELKLRNVNMFLNGLGLDAAMIE